MHNPAVAPWRVYGTNPGAVVLSILGENIDIDTQSRVELPARASVFFCSRRRPRIRIDVGTNVSAMDPVGPRCGVETTTHRTTSSLSPPPVMRVLIFRGESVLQRARDGADSGRVKLRTTILRSAGPL